MSGSQKAGSAGADGCTAAFQSRRRRRERRRVSPVLANGNPRGNPPLKSPVLLPTCAGRRGRGWAWTWKGGRRKGGWCQRAGRFLAIAQPPAAHVLLVSAAAATDGAVPEAPATAPPLAMKSMQGLLHKTSLQEAQERRQASLAPASVAGQKRTWSSGDTDPSRQPPASRGTVQFRRASSLPAAPGRLSASSIVQLREAATVSEYSQRRLIAATPSSSRDPELDLAHPTYDLPSQLVANFASLGIRQIYPWQKNCLKGPGLLDGDKNLVYCAPTGGGKSLVADLLMLKRIMREPGAKALLVLPYVALVQEKVRWLRNVVQDLRPPADPLPADNRQGPWRRRADQGVIRVVGFFGGGKVRATWDDFDIGANALINAAIEDCSIPRLRAVVLDELHMVDDDHRGYLLELIATKLLSLEQPVQIIGMSATLPNMNLMAEWLDAHCYETRYRPVPIEEHLVYDGKVFAAGSSHSLARTRGQLSQDVTEGRATPTRQIQNSAHKEFGDPVLNAVVSLAFETASTGFGSLVFAGSRAICESDARWISRVMPEPHQLGPALLDKRMELLSDLRSLNTGVDPVLEETVLYGVAFHLQAGLTSEERDLIAAAYDAGTILVCVATCSLAAGINLPARRVILHNARMGRGLIGPSMLRQMRGRAGRQGKSPVGETYLCCREGDLEQVLELMRANVPEVSSCLNTENRRIQRYVCEGAALFALANLAGRALLEVISIRLATGRESIRDYFSKSLLAHSHGIGFVYKCLESSLDEVQSMGLATDGGGSENFMPTQLGKAIVASAIDPDDGIFVHKELTRALRAFVMDGEMHILYVFTPVQDFGIAVNWQVFRSEMEALDESGLRVLSFIGIKPTEILKLAQGGSLKEKTEDEREVARVYRRFYLALQLRDLCNEVPIHVVSRKYDMPRGTVQTLSQTCQGFAAGMIKFCEQMGWGVMAAGLDHFSDRLMAGARTDLLELAKIPFIKSRTARVFWESGYRSVAAIANADAKELLPVLMQAQPNKIRLKTQNDEKLEEKMLAKAEVISAAANRLWQSQMRAEIDLE
ncbi:DNA polymerase theta [Tolypocladium capitatum]|uniref:DNA polymerase theta n=1 Tax=Tolypocladium capitatum TaxID=45235 RepID=A0A2K3QMR5_9HYPO|nr:DNA polymerase theta [Tolypocladium capitatum]